MGSLEGTYIVELAGLLSSAKHYILVGQYFQQGIGETGRAFNTPKKEHLRNTKTAAKGSRIILLITSGPTTTPLILKMHQLMTKALLEPGKH